MLTYQEAERFKNGIRTIRNKLLEWTDTLMVQNDRFTAQQMDELKVWRQQLRDATDCDLSDVPSLPYPITQFIPNAPEFLTSLCLQHPFGDVAVAEDNELRVGQSEPISTIS